MYAIRTTYPNGKTWLNTKTLVLDESKHTEEKLRRIVEIDGYKVRNKMAFENVHSDNVTREWVEF